MFLHDGLSGMYRKKEGVGLVCKVLMSHFGFSSTILASACVRVRDFLHPLFNSKCERCLNMQIIVAQR